jgi:hypothetical protein
MAISSTNSNSKGEKWDKVRFSTEQITGTACKKSECKRTRGQNREVKINNKYLKE